MIDYLERNFEIGYRASSSSVSRDIHDIAGSVFVNQQL